jgi:regulator of sigma E protease
MDIFGSVIYFIITIAILVFIHEFGHFAAAKLSGMRADIFAIGFGKRLFGYNKITGFTFGDLPKDWDGQGNTDYRICLLPLGGYVKIAGMIDETTKDENLFHKEPEPYEFRAKSTPKKMFVITAGVLMNLLLALFIFWGISYYNGKMVTPTTTVGYVAPDTPADSLGFREGDRILSINDREVSTWEDVRAAIHIHTLGENINVRVERNGSVETIQAPRKSIPEEDKAIFLIHDKTFPLITQVMPGSPAEEAGLQARDEFIAIKGKEIKTVTEVTEIISSSSNETIDVTVARETDTVTVAVTTGADGKIGVGLGYGYKGEREKIEYGFFEAFSAGWQEIERVTDLTFSMLGKVFTGRVEFGKAFGGPIKIAQVATTSAEAGFISFLYFLALLSLSLAIINIMPFPVLDGGHLIIIMVEGIMKREIPLKVKIAIQNVGVVLLLLLMAFIIYNDILSL